MIVNDLGGSVKGEGTSRAADLTVDLITPRGGTAAANYGDVSDHEQCGALVQQALDTHGRLDIVVNNAGIVRDAAIWNMPVEDFDLVLAVHLRGTWSMCHHAAKHFRAMSKAGEPVAGRIINTTSGRRAHRQLRPDQLRHRQGGHRRASPSPSPRSWPARA